MSLSKPDMKEDDELRADDFSDFFTKLHSKDGSDELTKPFLWQERLAATVAAEGKWHDVLDLPTGSGKTGAIDVALFHLALEAGTEGRRRAPLRIVFVVDRRVIVDAAYERAKHISSRLEEALRLADPSDVLYKVARRLVRLSAHKPLAVHALRGGAPRESEWARTPSQPTILCSTVDQVGSRLLFRGYGVSDSMKPIHAGLLGSDCLILLDEAHLSEPFRQTLAAVAKYRRPPWTEYEPAPWGYVVLTATPQHNTAQDGELRTFSLTEAERSDARLSPRLAAPKPARLVTAKGHPNRPTLYASEFAEHAWLLSGLTSSGELPQVVAIVVNRVAMARRCYREILTRITSVGASADAVLFIGRTRDVDRDRVMKGFLSRLVSGRALPERTLFIVATQCIEVGADFDFDALVTQVAPLDALRQRFGRLNRMGRDIPARAIILAAPDEIGRRANDPLYGTRARETWEWLIAQSPESTIDFGVNAMNTRLKGANVPKLYTEKRDAPVVLPAYTDLWAQTSPIPIADPETSLFLHGAPNGADVQLVWRADLDRESVGSAPAIGRAMTVLGLMPPRSAEAVTVPIQAARAWLSGKTAVPVNDVEGATYTEETQSEERLIYALRWCGVDSENTKSVKPSDIRPGDVLVVSAVEGGCDEYGWDPGGREPVSDVADQAAEPYAERKFVLRIHRNLLENALRGRFSQRGSEPSIEVDDIWRDLYRALQEVRSESSSKEIARRLLRVADLPDYWRNALVAIASKSRKDVSAFFPYEDEDSEYVTGVVFVAPRGIGLGETRSEEMNEPSTEGDDAGSFTTEPVDLSTHSRDVEAEAIEFARLVGFPEAIARDIALAAFLHDEGKRDERFQLYLRRGDRLQRMIDQRVLAKSDRGSPNRRLDALARRIADLPDRWRHEADSVRRALNHPRFPDACERILVLWLIGTHHGFGRPFYPHTDPDLAGPQDLDFQIDGHDWVQIFSRLLRRFGPWELARLEAIVRLADHRASEKEDRRREKPEVPQDIEAVPS